MATPASTKPSQKEGSTAGRTSTTITKSRTMSTTAVDTVKSKK